jgi:hypothetical protein
MAPKRQKASGRGARGTGADDCGVEQICWRQGSEYGWSELDCACQGRVSTASREETGDK